VAPVVQGGRTVTADRDDFARALSLHAEGRLPESEALCRAILARDAAHARALHLLGAIRWQAGDRAQAVDLLGRAVAAKADYAEAQFNLGAMLAECDRLADAAEHYGRAAALRPDHVDSHARLGAVLMLLRQYVAAEQAYQRVLDLQPDHPGAHAELITAAALQGKIDAALARGRRAAELVPDGAVIHFRLGGVLRDCGEHVAAMSHYRRALDLGGDDLACRRAIVQSDLYAPEVTAVERHADVAAKAQAVVARCGAALPPPGNERDPERRLRIGWLSSDFREHPVGRNLAPLFANAARNGADYFCYANVAVPDDATEWFRNRSDAWRAVNSMSDGEVARLIRADEIDVMIYLAGLFDGNRPEIAALRPAPVQVSLFDAATSGLPHMDYFIADTTTVPPRATETFSERVVRLPCFIIHLPIEGAPDVAPPPRRGLGQVTFGSFSNPAKLSRPALRLWGDILRRLPQAQLRLKYRDLFASRVLQARVRDHVGVGAGRIEFQEAKLTYVQNLAAYADIDIALDCFPFNGATTTFEALWMGVPVVTLAGDTFMSRWSTSLLHLAGLDELIARTPQEYIDIAVALAEDPKRRATLRATLRARVAGSALCNAAHFSRHFERLMRALWRRWCHQDRT